MVGEFFKEFYKPAAEKEELWFISIFNLKRYGITECRNKFIMNLLDP